LCKRSSVSCEEECQGERPAVLIGEKEKKGVKLCMGQGRFHGQRNTGLIRAVIGLHLASRNFHGREVSVKKKVLSERKKDPRSRSRDILGTGSPRTKSKCPWSSISWDYEKGVKSGKRGSEEGGRVGDVEKRREVDSRCGGGGGRGGGVWGGGGGGGGGFGHKKYTEGKKKKGERQRGKNAQTLKVGGRG